MSCWRAHCGPFMNWHSSLTSSVLRLLLDRHRWVKVRLPERAKIRPWQLTRLSSQLSSLQGEPPTEETMRPVLLFSSLTLTNLYHSTTQDA